MAGATTASAGVRAGFKHLDVVAGEDIAAEVHSFLRIDGSAAARALFESYWQDVKRIDEETDRRMLDAGYETLLGWEERWLEEQLHAAETGSQLRFPPRTEEICELKYRTNLIRLQGRERADRRLERWIAELGERLEIPGERLDRVPALVRRRLFTFELHENHRQVFNPKVNLLLLVDAESDRGGTLEDVAADPHGRRTLARIMRRYEVALDGVIQRGLALTTRRRPRPDAKPIYTPDDPEWEDLHELYSRRASDYYDTLCASALEIGALAEATVSSQAREAWLDRVDAAVFPALFVETCVDEAMAWLDGRADVTDTQRQVVADLYAAHRMREKPLRRRAINAYVRIVRSHYMPQGHDPTRLDLAYGERVAALRELAEDTIDLIIGQLTERQRSDLQSAVLRSCRLGPDVDSRLLP